MTPVAFLILCAVILIAPHIRQGPAIGYAALVIFLAAVVWLKG